MSKYLIQFGDANRAPSKSIAPVLAEMDRVRTQEDYEALVRFAYRKRANGGLEFWTVKKEHKDVSFFRVWAVPEDWEGEPNVGATIDDNPFGGYTDEEFDAARAAADKAREERKAEKAAAEAAKPVPAPVTAKVGKGKPTVTASKGSSKGVVVAASKSSGSPATGKVTITQEEKEAVNAFLQSRDVVTYTRLGVVFGLLKG